LNAIYFFETNPREKSYALIARFHSKSVSTMMLGEYIMKNFIQKMFCIGLFLLILASLPVDLALLSRLGRGPTILVSPRPPTAQKSDNFVEPVLHV
jgi:ABC-type multidrug transport system permease subunit